MIDFEFESRDRAEDLAAPMTAERYGELERMPVGERERALAGRPDVEVPFLAHRRIGTRVKPAGCVTRTITCDPVTLHMAMGALGCAAEREQERANRARLAGRAAEATGRSREAEQYRRAAGRLEAALDPESASAVFGVGHPSAV